jgi:choline dehydrogenase-like flavoprotein
LRWFGGSSNHWGGYCRPLDPIDFEERDWVPHSGWPFGIEELAPYYPPASELVEIAPAHFADQAYWQETTKEVLPEPVTGRMQVRYVHFSPPTRFGSRYGPELERAANIKVLLHANLVNIAATAGANAVTHLAIRTLEGRNHQVRAKVYVLATGGLENARLLLSSNDVISGGLGNQNDLVGRFFMEHPHVSGFAEAVVADLKRLPKIYRERVLDGNRAVKAAFNPSEDFLREMRLLNATFMLGVAGRYSRDAAADSERSAAHMDMLKAARHFLSDGDRPADANAPEPLGYWLGMGCACEQAPNPDSRVALAEERDALGLRKIRLDWRLTEQDRRSLLEHMRSLAMELGALGIGRILLRLADDGIWPERVSGGSHHMGTTRMHDDPKRGVVDRNARVHGVDNLYVAGSSVFPTSGEANPTLTLIALTLRLADHLRTRL